MAKSRGPQTLSDYLQVLSTKLNTIIFSHLYEDEKLSADTYKEVSRLSGEFTALQTEVKNLSKTSIARVDKALNDLFRLPPYKLGGSDLKKEIQTAKNCMRQTQEFKSIDGPNIKSQKSMIGAGGVTMFVNIKRELLSESKIRERMSNIEKAEKIIPDFKNIPALFDKIMEIRTNYEKAKPPKERTSDYADRLERIRILEHRLLEVTNENLAIFENKDHKLIAVEQRTILTVYSEMKKALETAKRGTTVNSVLKTNINNVYAWLEKESKQLQASINSAQRFRPD